ncbi:MAG: Smr/MutS family protein [Gammaproteobacteria bacterium]
MTKKNNSDSNENALFRNEVKGVRKLKSDKVTHQKPPPRPIPKQRIRDEASAYKDTLSDQMDFAEIETGDELLFSRSGLQNTLLRKLRRGQFSIQAELDLHGMTVNIAKQELLSFLANCKKNHYRCVRIIHGKGLGSPNQLPKIKNSINRWLRQIDDVLAFSSARPADGGTGAVYVLIKQNKN